MDLLDSGPDSDVDIKTDNEYAKNYNNWRKKEELNKLKTKYGEEVLSDSSSSSDDDEEGVELTENVEKEFFKTLSYLKNKDPRIYDQTTTFFQEQGDKPTKKKKEKPLFIKDYERKLLLENEGKLSESDEENEQPRSPTYVEEQRRLKESLKEALNSDDEDNDESNWGGLFKTREKTDEEKRNEEEDYKEWLKGQKEEIEDKDFAGELKPLKDYWNDPNLDEGEKFLRDYILNKRFLSNEDEDYIPTYDEIVHDSDKDLSEDENQIDKQEEFEHKYNFRFEEPDQEFIKRYPRSMENSVRKTDDRRKVKRQEIKERKQKEKEEKMQDLKKLQELKKKEIEEKIQKLRDITGNEDMEFKDDDLDGDFDPEEHDKRMRDLFNDDYYKDEEDDRKPEFPELDDYLELEDWDKYEGEEGAPNESQEEYVPHCDDEDFNMDADYDPNTDVKKELIENSKGKKKRRRKSLFAKAVSQPKPVFDPKDKTFEEYLDEYYKFDCEDIIGDMPCRFKYRQVVPNSFGLTIEEILAAKDRELNKWCSLKKTVQIRADYLERNDQKVYENRARNIGLKKKIMPSLFEPEERNETNDNGKEQIKEKKQTSEVNDTKRENIKETNEVAKISGVVQKVSENTVQVNKKKKKTKTTTNQNQQRNDKQNNQTPSPAKEGVSKKKKQQNLNKKNILKANEGKKRKLVDQKQKNPKKKLKKGDDAGSISDARLSAYGINPKKFKNKIKYGKNKV